MLVSFVDNTNLFSDRPEIEARIQQILDIYNRLHTATGGKIEENKTSYYSWRWH